MSAELYKALQGIDLGVSSFLVAKQMSGRVLTKELAYLLDVFNALPCPETAISLIEHEAKMAPLIFYSEVLKSQFITSIERKQAGLEAIAWIQSAKYSAGVCDAVHEFLLRMAEQRTIKIGFHLMRDQKVLVDRLGGIGITKGWFSDRRQFLRDTICRNISAYKSVVDLVCIWGARDGHEYFWDGLGERAEPHHYECAEVLFSLETQVSEFEEVLSLISMLRPDTYVGLPKPV
jgi:hypothetical protein